MCCNAHSKADTANATPSGHVTEDLVATPLPDGYWLHALPFNKKSIYPDLVGYGLGFLDKPAAIKLLINPKNSGSDGWKLTEIQSLEFPVAMTYADLTGDGNNDIIICDRYGPGMGDLWDAKIDNGGRVQWLHNPGDRSAQPHWKAQHIGNSTGMHRLLAGHFTETDHFQIMGLPIISASSDLDSPAPVIIYTPKYGSDTSVGPESWSENVAFVSEFRLIHEAKLLPGTNDGLDMVLVAGKEGVILLWFNKSTEKWDHNVVGTGLHQEGENIYWGSGSVDVASVGDDPVGYIATCEAFHGNTVAVYVKPVGSTKGAASLKEKIWTRHQVDSFGPLHPTEFTGTIHNVHATKTGTNNFESFAIACMGAPVGIVDNQGVYVYTPTDLAGGKFQRTKVSEESAGRLAIAGFSESTKQEIGSISYYVPGYHTGPDPPSVRINSLTPFKMASRTQIIATKLNKEVLLQVPRPAVIPEGVVPTMPLLTIAGKKNSLVVLRPGQVMVLAHKAGAKVIYGTLEMITLKKELEIRGVAPPAKDIWTSHPLSDDGKVKAGEHGAVFIHVEALEGHFQGPYHTMEQVSTTNLLAQVPDVPADVKAMEFPFIQVQDLEWGDKDGQGLWNDFAFYNMTGFYIFFNDDAMEEICHMQAWTLGMGETARFHNHSDKSFCEIHYCLSNGGGKGSMRYFADEDEAPIDLEGELTKSYVDSHATKLVVPTMFEHGPLWKIVPGTKATPRLRPNDTADYPWHAWLASRFGEWTLPHQPPLSAVEQKFDVWLAFEFPTSAFQY